MFKHFTRTTRTYAKCYSTIYSQIGGFCLHRVTSPRSFHTTLCKLKEDNLSGVLKKVNELVLEQRPVPEASRGDVILAIDCVGICGSDVHYWKHGSIGPFVLKDPMIIGHEASGIVVCCGEGVKSLKVGDRVAIEPGVPCRMCEYCRGGRYNLCPHMKFCATPPVDGNLTRYYKHAADYCFKLPDYLTMEEGALLEPISCAMSACRRGHVKMGMNVLILGSGPIGLCALLVARSLGANKIMLTDIKEYRLKSAEELGADLTLLTTADEKIPDLSKRCIEKMGCRPDRTIDCSGTVATAQLSLAVTKNGGVCCFVGMAGDVVPIPLVEAVSREVDIVGIFRYCNDYPNSLALAASRKLCLKRLVTHHFDIKDTVKAFETAHKQEKGTIKVMIHVQPRDKNNKEKFDS